MKRICSALLCLAVLLLTACGAENQDEKKEHYYEVLDSAGEVLYTERDGELVDTLDSLLGTPVEEMEHSQAGEDINPLYTYVYWQEKTLLAGEDPEEEREYEELIHVLVPAEGETLVIQVFPNVDGLKNLNWLTKETVDMEELLRSAVTVSPETAEALRDPARFVGD